MQRTDYVISLDQLGIGDVALVGGKNASLGEMIAGLAGSGVCVPPGFATTAAAYHDFLEQTDLGDRISRRLDGLDVDDVGALAAAGREIRQWVLDTPLPAALQVEVERAWRSLSDGDETLAFAVRSSATAEDLPEASFAGQQETFLNVRGLPAIIRDLLRVYASLFTDRAIAYRTHHGFAHEAVAVSVGVQRMVRSDIGASGVMFTLDTESGFADVVLITAAYGLGETVVQGAVNPDEFYVHKPGLAAGRPAIVRRTLGSKAIRMVYADEGADSPVRTEEVEEGERGRFALDDRQVEELARLAVRIETHYGRAMDIEWALDGDDGGLYIVQARPETVRSRDNGRVIERFRVTRRGDVLATGRSIGQRIGHGPARVVTSIRELSRVQPGDVLVADMTDPDWEPVMKRAAAIVTNRGGRTCHAAIIARELGVPAVVGCGNATRSLRDGDVVTVSCAEGDTGFVYEGRIDYERREIELAGLPELPFKISMNVGNPDRAFDFQWIPNAGVGLARLEFIISTMISVHPKAALYPDRLDEDTRAEVSARSAGYEDPRSFYVHKLAEGIATIAAAFHPKPVIVRTSDFKSNEYANLVGGSRFEPDEENPMLGFRGASRYIAESFRDCFELECEALRYVRDTMGLANVWVMVPFVRTLGEADAVIELLAANGLRRGENDLRIIMMCELPSNAILADAFLERFDGFSIGSNDLTQLTLGLDRDSSVIAHLFDERDPAVKELLHRAIQSCRRAGKYVGICGQGPSDHPDLARWLMDEGIESVSLNPDSVIETWLFLAGMANGES